MPSVLNDCAVLREMFRTRMAIAETGDAVPIHSNLPEPLVQGCPTRMASGAGGTCGRATDRI